MIKLTKGIKEGDALRDLYRPVRSIVDSYKNLNLNFIEVIPKGYLSKYIYSYWKLDCDYELTNSFDINIIPNGCVDLMFNKNASQYVYIWGASRKAFKEKILSSPDIFGIRFLPSQINRFFKLPFEDIHKNPIRFNRLMKREFLELEEKLFSVATFPERIKVMEDYLKKQLLQNKFNINYNLLNAIYRVLKSKGNLRMEDISNEISLSCRYTRKLFKEQLGITPKEFAKIIRFQNAYKTLLEASNCKLIDLALENGYFDQAHFIKEFKNYAGVTPTKYKK